MARWNSLAFDRKPLRLQGFEVIGATGFEPVTSSTPNNVSPVVSTDLSELTATPSARCTSRCTETGNEPNADPLAGFVASLTPADRARLVTLLTGQAEGGTVQPEQSSRAAERENQV